MSNQTILVIAPFPPIPDNGGGIAIFGDLYELKQRGVVVDLICFRAGRTSESIQSIQQICRHLVIIDGPPPWSPGIVLNAFLRQRPMVVVRHRTGQMTSAIAKQLATHPYDVVLVEFSFMFQYFLSSNLEFTGKRPLLIVDHLVVTPKVYEYFRRIEHNPLLRQLRWYELPRLQKYLRQVLTVGDKHLFEGQEDLDYVLVQNSDLIDQEKLIYRPTGLLLERYPLADPAQVEPCTVGFFGAFDWEANVDAALYFVEDILPLIQAELPQIKFVLAGRAAPSQVRELAQYPFIEFLGQVEDMFSVAQRVAAIVVPLRIGAGTRLKILEAMAWGKPIVTTSIGVEGVEHVNGEDLIVADTADLFAKATIALLNDPVQQGRLAQAGRQRVELFYSTQCSVDRLQAAMAVPSPA